jgi:outer membrane protein assembly factor BamB
MTIDQLTLRRTRKLGLTAHDPSRASPGYTLYTPMYSDGTVYLLDMEGNEVHTWKLPFPPGDYGYLLPNGNLFYLGKTPEGTAGLFPAFSVFMGGALMEVDWDSNIVWEHHDPAHHHDGRRTDNGGAAYLSIAEIPKELAARVRGGLPNSEHEGRMFADRIREVDRDGNLTWEWNSWEHLDPEVDVITPTDLRDEWSHSNTIVPLPNGDYMISMRNISTVARVDRKTGNFAWKITPPLLAQQHDPNFLDNGNVLVFNNGTQRRNVPLIFSNIVEVEPVSGSVVWNYRDSSSMMSFFSSYISGVQRLPNGNTFITEGISGRMFEVTPLGEVVWEYTNPYFFEARVFGNTNAVFRARRYPAELFPKLK